MTMTNNFVGLNLNHLKEHILEENCTLKLYCKNFNIRTVRLETDKGKLIAQGTGFSLIPNLKKISNKKRKMVFKLPFSTEILDTKVDSYLMSGATVTIKKSSSDVLEATIEEWDGNILLTTTNTDLTSLLCDVENYLPQI